MQHKFKYIYFTASALLLNFGVACGSDAKVGAPGDQGPAGLDGAPGEDGSEGNKGKDGLPGRNGEDGQAAEAIPFVQARLIELDGERFFPEGITIDEQGFLYTGSIPSGEITRIDLGTGERSVFSTVARNTIGLLATEKHLLACDVGMTTDYAEPSAVLVLDLKDGSELGRHEFPAGAQFCNDLTTDKQGNVYASESFANGLYKLNLADLESNVALSLFSNDALFSENMVFGNFGLNGLSFDGESTIHVVNFYSGELFAVPILEDGTAGSVSRIPLTDSEGTERLLAAPDGMKQIGPGMLMVSEQSKNWLSRVDLSTGVITPVAAGFDVPSTFAFDPNGHVWVVNSQLDDFAAGTAPSLPFTLQRAPLD